jgi:hypothetical protein
MTFEMLCKLAGTITAALCFTLLFAPGLIHWLFQIDSTSGADVMSRRAAMLFAGLSTLAFLTSEATTSELRRTTCAVVCITMAGLAVLGLFEWIRGAVGAGIILAITVELFFVYWFHRFWQEE